MIIRQEQLKDFDNIYTFVKKAFETAQVKDGEEQDFVNCLRASSYYIPELALVAEENTTLIGYIMLTEIEIKETKIKALLLAPLCVELNYRKKGIGGDLIKEAFRLAREKQYESVFLCGNPVYYSRFGFKNLASNFDIIDTSDIPKEYVMVYELFPGVLKNKKGTIHIA